MKLFEYDLEKENYDVETAMDGEEVALGSEIHTSIRLLGLVVIKRRHGSDAGELEGEDRRAHPSC
ncbi:MAG: hypothetical protein U5K84_12510 [Alkalibacterium sp.]|nr:hypothetical protein [Alkalibacterium sp.]